jgi:signal transduction histidine kinase
VELLNTGHPIPENDLERIFEQFYRVEKSRSITHGGSGLGLTIVKKIIELHDGSITITNEGENLIKVAIFLPITSRNHYSFNYLLPLKEN